MKRKFESVIILKPIDNNEEVDKIINKYEKLLKGFSNKDVETENLGKKRLAYTVRNFDYGNYLVFYYYANSENIAELERNLRIDDDVIKFITVAHEEQLEEDEEQEDEEM